MAIVGTRNDQKDPDATLDWIFDWSEWLGGGETLVDSVMSVTPGLNITDTDQSVSTTTAWLSGGTEGRVYQLSNKVTTSAGRIDERSISIRVTNR